MHATTVVQGPAKAKEQDWTGVSSGNPVPSWRDQVAFGPADSATVVEEPSRPVPSVEELLESDPISQAVAAIQVIAAESFGEAVGGAPDLSAGFDEVLGGPYLSVELSVSGIDRDTYRQRRRDFDQAVREGLTPEQMSRVIWASRLDA